MRSFFILIESTSTVTATCVLLSSGHTIFTSIVSPTDFDLIFKKVTDDNAEKFVHNQDKENEEYLKELKKKL